MTHSPPKQLILVGNRTVALPEEVSAAAWSLERNRVQNARIKAVLGCIRMLDEVLDSNYAILHCSPDRLQEIWRRVRQIVDSIRNHLGPLLEEPSVVPRLEEARQQASASFQVLASTTLERLARHSPELPTDGLLGMRKLLCVTIGKLHSFLQETFGGIMAADPRSQFDRDYFLSRRFPRDIEEAEWLYRGVANLSDYVHEVLKESTETVLPLVKRLHQEEVLPAETAWQAMREFMDLLRDLTTKLNELLALRGIRFDEMELLDLYAREFPAKYHQLTALYAAGRDISQRIRASTPAVREQREQSVTDLLHVHAIIGVQVAELAGAVHTMILDLDAFLSIWYRSIGERRALLLYSSQSTLVDPTEDYHTRVRASAR
ncbi:MAG: hypothetical protein IH936_05710 [Acidobacteria bacterium]|nr:hypothetical protein [Acidobacteriota bacterium]